MQSSAIDYTTAPGAPVSVTVEFKVSTSVQVTWLEPIDTNGVIQGYQVLYFGYKGTLSESENNTGQETLKLVVSQNKIYHTVISFFL